MNQFLFNNVQCAANKHATCNQSDFLSDDARLVLQVIWLKSQAGPKSFFRWRVRSSQTRKKIHKTKLKT